MTEQSFADTKGQTAFDWNAYAGRVEVLMSMQNDPEHTDTVLVTDDGSQFPANATVLSVLGPEFTKLMVKQIEDVSIPNVVLRMSGRTMSLKKVHVGGVSSEAIQSLVDSCYTGQLIMSDETVWKVMECAEKYQMRNIELACCNFLSYLVTNKNCLQMYLVAKQKQSSTLLDGSLLSIERNFATISKSRLFFSTIETEDLNVLLSDDFLNVDNEAIVWTAIKRWITFDKKERIKELHKLIGHIRYHRAPVKLFEEMANDSLVIEADAVVRVHKILETIMSARRSRKFNFDGNMMPVGKIPVTIRPRIPKSVLFAVGGWKTGQTCALIETYDYMTNQWFRLSNPEAGPRKAYHGIEILDNKMYVIGGTNGNEILDTVHVYDPVTNTWTPKKSLSTKRCYVATALMDGKIYAIGGHNGEFRMRSAEVYDPKQDEWSPIADMIIARSDGAAAALNGRIYVAGGLNEGSIEASLEAYEPEKNEWTILRRMHSPRTSLALSVFDSCLYAIGGNSGTARLASVERYDPDTNTWTAVSEMSQRRSTFKSAVVNGRIYVCGGYNGSNPISKCELFNPETQVWKEVAGLSAARSGLAVVAIDKLPNIKDLTFYGNSK